MRKYIIKQSFEWLPSRFIASARSIVPKIELSHLELSNKVGIRPHNITTYKEGNNSLEIKGKVLISELSGSESLIHFTKGDLSWVSLSNGIFQKYVGDEMNLYMNADEFIYFDENERLVTNG